MPSLRYASLLGLFALALASPAGAAGEKFGQWLRDVKKESLRRGISEKTLASAFSGISYNPRVIELDRKQPESRLTFGQYKKNVISAERIGTGIKNLKRHGEEIEKASKAYGVPGEIIVALWGMETSYGKNTGGFDVIEALATLAYDGRRSSFFRDELFKALAILDDGHIDHAEMQGSWAGAMGQNQFMPSSFQAYAVDGNGDGKRDIWRSLPDVFASTANYLHKSGWKNGEIWGREVKLSQPVPKSLTGLEIRKSNAAWRKMGVMPVEGNFSPEEGETLASLILPAGTDGPAYLVYDNYRVLMKWNKSIYFATSVGILSDALAVR